jgi:hypothetical protein
MLSPQVRLNSALSWGLGWGLEQVAAFLASQDDVRTFLRTYADIDLAGVRFSESIHSWRPVQPGNRAARHRCT